MNTGYILNVFCTKGICLQTPKLQYMPDTNRGSSQMFPDKTKMRSCPPSKQRMQILFIPLSQIPDLTSQSLLFTLALQNTYPRNQRKCYVGSGEYNFSNYICLYKQFPDVQKILWEIFHCNSFERHCSKYYIN